MNRAEEYSKDGYKQSPLGLIPDDWYVERMFNIADVYSGGTPKSSNLQYFDGNIPFIKSGEIGLLQTEQYISEDGLKASSAKMVKKGDLLYALYGATSGQCAISKINGAINQAVLCIRPQCDRYYLLCVLEKNKDFYYRRYLQGGQGNLSAEIVKRYYIPIPPLAEQRKIAEVLSTWDKAIELQTAIINKLTLRKKGLMQQLLTSKKRLKGFSEPWKQVKIGDVGKTYTGLTGLNKEDFENIGSKYIPYINIYKNSVVDTNSLCDVRINDSCQNKVKCGDVFFTTSSETPDEVGVASVLLKDVDDLYLNSFCFGYRILDVQMLSSEYSVYLFRSAIFRHKIIKLAQGSTRFNISKEEVMKVKLLIPSIKEQLAIAGFLGSADKEIEKEKKKLEALEQQKKGLMQQLLTGKKRVIIN